MLEIILLLFITRHIGQMAVRRGLAPRIWKFKLIAYWFLFEILGFFLGITMFKFTIENIGGLMLLCITCAFGGYLLVRNQLEKTPENTDNY